eukprot:GHVU01201435.1.p1 GENE.GHVU01201435.1~~GHVU01201435.1.p1  ORF type:complete len:750 (-),score=123.13 GHVU01201435.1:397-2646(-)
MEIINAEFHHSARRCNRRIAAAGGRSLKKRGHSTERGLEGGIGTQPHSAWTTRNDKQQAPKYGSGPDKNGCKAVQTLVCHRDLSALERSRDDMERNATMATIELDEAKRTFENEREKLQEELLEERERFAERELSMEDRLKDLTSKREADCEHAQKSECEVQSLRTKVKELEAKSTNDKAQRRALIEKLQEESTPAPGDGTDSESEQNGMAQLREDASYLQIATAVEARVKNLKVKVKELEAQLQAKATNDKVQAEALMEIMQEEDAPSPRPAGTTNEAPSEREGPAQLGEGTSYLQIATAIESRNKKLSGKNSKLQDELRVERARREAAEQALIDTEASRQATEDKERRTELLGLQLTERGKQVLHHEMTLNTMREQLSSQAFEVTQLRDQLDNEKQEKKMLNSNLKAARLEISEMKVALMSGKKKDAPATTHLHGNGSYGTPAFGSDSLQTSDVAARGHSFGVEGSAVHSMLGGLSAPRTTTYVSPSAVSSSSNLQSMHRNENLVASKSMLGEDVLLRGEHEGASALAPAAGGGVVSVSSSLVSRLNGPIVNSQSSQPHHGLEGMELFEQISTFAPSAASPHARPPAAVATTPSLHEGQLGIQQGQHSSSPTGSGAGAGMAGLVNKPTSPSVVQSLHFNEQSNHAIEEYIDREGIYKGLSPGSTRSHAFARWNSGKGEEWSAAARSRSSSNSSRGRLRTAIEIKGNSMPEGSAMSSMMEADESDRRPLLQDSSELPQGLLDGGGCIC